MTDKLLIAILAALVVWGIKSIVSHFIKRRRLRNGLLADIKIHISGAKEQTGAVKSLVENTLKVGSKVPFPIAYNVGHYSFYDSVRGELPGYLWQGELIKIIKFYQTIWELDVSINGLVNAVSTWERDKENLTDENMQHIMKRKARIDSLYSAITTNEISSISSLPDDYREVKGADTVVE